MALQEVVRDYIFHYHTSYLDHYSERLDTKDTVCRSCGKSFKNVWVFAKYNVRNVVKRHLSCAIAHNVITIKEARELAQKSSLTIDWQYIDNEAKHYLEARRTNNLALFSWVMGVISFISLVPVVPL